MVDSARKRLYTRRSLLLSGGVFSLMAGLASRMYYLQVVEGEQYRTLAEENRISLKLIAPTRGEIVDRYGEPMATNVQNYRVLVTPKQAGNVEKILEKLSSFIQLSDDEFKKVMNKTKKSRSFVPQIVRKNLTWEEVSRIGVNKPDLPGVDIDEGETRYYPDGHAVAHIVGYVGSPSEKQVKKNPILSLPDFKVGEIGLERGWETVLRGVGGNKNVEVDAFGRIVRELSYEKPKSGQQLVSTIDLELQRRIAERVKSERAASVVVMDAQRGDILAMVSVPSYDTNKFTDGISHRDWNALMGNPLTPLTNRSTRGQYAPGSTFKMVVALAALEAGIPHDHATFCTGALEYGNMTFHCWKKGGHGHVDMHKSLVESCDIWYYEVAKKIGIAKIGDMAKRLGLGQNWNTMGLGRMAGGLVPTKAWKMAVKGQSWQVGDTMIAGIGQGYVLATPLQLAVMTSRLVTGKSIRPFITRDLLIGKTIYDRSQTKVSDLNIPQQHLNWVKNAMKDVVNDPEHGTAKYSALRGKWSFGGKTGTSQVRRISKAERETGVLKNEEIEWRQRDHSLFVGYSPVNDPKYTVAVLVEHGGSGSVRAAPLARDVFKMMRDLAKMPRHELEPEDLANPQQQP